MTPETKKAPVLEHRSFRISLKPRERNGDDVDDIKSNSFLYQGS